MQYNTGYITSKTNNALADDIKMQRKENRKFIVCRESESHEIISKIP